jgi:hypothetical protein
MGDKWSFEAANKSVAATIRRLERRNDEIKKYKIDKSGYKAEFDENSGALDVNYSLVEGVCLESRKSFIRELEELQKKETPSFDDPMSSASAVKKGWDKEISRLIADLKESE